MLRKHLCITGIIAAAVIGVFELRSSGQTQPVDPLIGKTMEIYSGASRISGIYSGPMVPQGKQYIFLRDMNNQKESGLINPEQVWMISVKE